MVNSATECFVRDKTHAECIEFKISIVIKRLDDPPWLKSVATCCRFGACADDFSEI